MVFANCFVQGKDERIELIYIIAVSKSKSV